MRSLKQWRQDNHLTQVDAATLLGVSQPYLSLLEQGARPFTEALRLRVKASSRDVSSNPSVEDRFRKQLGELGYPGFAHLRSKFCRPSQESEEPLPNGRGSESGSRSLAQLASGASTKERVKTRSRVRPDALLLDVLSRADTDARVAEALPWLVRSCRDQMNYAWLVRQAKLSNLQNRRGFVLQVSMTESPELQKALNELGEARLLQEVTLWWASMQRRRARWMRTHRSQMAKQWNILTMLRVQTDKGAEAT